MCLSCMLHNVSIWYKICQTVSRYGENVEPTIFHPLGVYNYRFEGER